LLLLRTALGPNSINLPLDQEIGGGAFLRNVVKAGVTSGGAIRFIPRPESLGDFFMAYFGHQEAPVQIGTGTAYTHSFKFSGGQFYAPYYTVRNSPGGMFGQQMPDMRMAALAFDFRARDFVRASAAFLGGTPSNVSTATWDATTYLDDGPQFLTALSSIKSPSDTTWKVLSGSVSLESAIPLEDQWIVGSYSPDDFNITARGISLNMIVKVADDGVLYNKMMLDPAGGSAWVADLLKESDISLKFVSNAIAGLNVAVPVPFSFEVKANGSAVAGEENVVFQVSPLDLIPGRQITMNVVATFLADPSASDSPASIDLINTNSVGYEEPVA
jgi:hypothetical protein